MIHKIFHIGESGIVFTKCGDVRGNIRDIQATYKDEDVTCKKCLEEMIDSSPERISERGKE